MLSPTVDTIRLFLHVLGACVWVGGQIALAGIVPSVRKEHAESTKTIARAFGRVAWTSFGLVVVTGIWNLIEVDVQSGDWRYNATVVTHVLLSVIAGIAAAVHAIGKTRIALALGGALGLVSSLGALFVGVILRSGN